MDRAVQPGGGNKLQLKKTEGLIPCVRHTAARTRRALTAVSIFYLDPAIKSRDDGISKSKLQKILKPFASLREILILLSTTNKAHNLEFSQQLIQLGRDLIDCDRLRQSQLNRY